MRVRSIQVLLKKQDAKISPCLAIFRHLLQVSSSAQQLTKKIRLQYIRYNISY